MNCVKSCPKTFSAGVKENIETLMGLACRECDCDVCDDCELFAVFIKLEKWVAEYTENTEAEQTKCDDIYARLDTLGLAPIKTYRTIYGDIIYWGDK